MGDAPEQEPEWGSLSVSYDEGIDVVKMAYGWSIAVDGTVAGLVAGDQGFDVTHIVIPRDHIVALVDGWPEYTRAELSDAMTARIAELEAAIKRQAGAAKTLRELTLSEVQHIRDSERKEYFASNTLDSERAANTILTDENEALQDHITKLETLNAELVKALVECRDELDAYSRNEYSGDHPVHQRYRKRDFDANPARIALAKAKATQ